MVCCSHCISGKVDMKPVAFVHVSRVREGDDYWGGYISELHLADHLSEESLIGLDEFSHIEVIFMFDKVADERVCWTSRHPRGRADWPRVGILAQRGKSRPNKLGLSRCRVLEVSGRVIRVEGLDALEGTPVLDIKPWMEEFSVRGEVQQPDWSHELMTHYYDDFE